MARSSCSMEPGMAGTSVLLNMEIVNRCVSASHSASEIYSSSMQQRKTKRTDIPRALNLVESHHIRGLDKTSEIDGIPLDALDLVARFAGPSTTLRGGKRMAARVLH